VISAVVLVFAILFAAAVLPTPLRKRLTNIEQRFISNINERENRRTGRENNLVSDLHLAYMKVGHSCPFVGEKLRNLDLRTRYGVNLAGIQRGGKRYPVPSGDMRIFPGDVLGVIATEEQIQRMLPLVEAQNEQGDDNSIPDVKFVHFAISEQSPIVGVKLEKAGLREDYGALLVAVQRGEDDYISPTPGLTFLAGDILWIVGNPKQLSSLKG
jgi:CPA2 family monovalent cation:H+ antiporter-2